MNVFTLTLTTAGMALYLGAVMLGDALFGAQTAGRHRKQVSK